MKQIFDDFLFMQNWLFASCLGVFASCLGVFFVFAFVLCVLRFAF